MKSWLKLIVLSLLIAAGAQFFNHGSASAAIGPGYFKGNDYDTNGAGDFVLPGGTSTNPSIPFSVNSVSSFESFIENKYNNGSTWEKTGAAYIIQTMRGRPYDHNMPSTSDISNWENQIASFVGTGNTIKWDRTDSFCQNTENIKDHVISDSDPDDVADFADTNSDGSCISWDHLIEFINKDGSIAYAIKHTCANPVAFKGLPPTVNWQLSGASTVSPTKVTSTGTQITFTHTIANSGPDIANPVDWRVEGCYFNPNKGVGYSNASNHDNTCTGDGDFGPGQAGGSPGLPGPNTAVIKVGSSNKLVVVDHYRFSFKNSPQVGDEFCERITFDNGNGPGTTDNTNSGYGDNSTKVCAIYGSVTPTLSVACDTTTSGHADAQYIVTSAYIKAAGTQYSTQSDSSPTWSGIPIPSSGSVSVSLYVKNSSGTYTLITSKTLSNTNCKTLSNTLCPVYDTFGDSTGRNDGAYDNIKVTIPTPTTIAKGTPSYVGQTFTDTTFHNITTNVDNIVDISTGGTHGNRSNGPQYPRAVLASTSSNTANPVYLNYTPYLSYYPYDYNQSRLDYTVNYTANYYNYEVIQNPDGTLAWQYDSESLNVPGSTSGSVSSPSILCYYRHYTLSGWNPAPAGTLNDQEDPSQAKFTYGVTAAFSGNAPGSYNAGGTTGDYPLRVASTITLNQSLNNGGPGSCGNDNGNTFTITSPLESYSTGTSPPLSFTCSVSAPPLTAGGKVCANFDIKPGGGNINSSGAIQGGVTAPDLIGSACTQPLANEPYAQFFGNDVSAGGEFDLASNSCTGSDPTHGTGSYAEGTIKAFVDGSGTLSARGAGTQFAALAHGNNSSGTSDKGAIYLFNTANLRTTAGAYPTTPTGLTFANVSTNGPAYGSSLGLAHCVPDYMATNPLASSGPNWSAAYSNLQTSGAYYSTSSISIGNVGDPAVTLPNGTSIAIYVKGNVTINRSILFTDTGHTVSMTNGAYTTNIPSLFIIATGNINIAPSVNEVDGVYIAQPDGSGHGGVINTCATGTNDLFSAATCGGTPLAAKGAFIANNVRLYRTFSSVRNSADGEYPTTFNPSLANCSVGDNGQPLGQNNNRTGTLNFVCGSEVLEFNPELLLGSPNIGGQKSQGRFDDITSLSPVL